MKSLTQSISIQLTQSQILQIICSEIEIQTDGTVRSAKSTNLEPIAPFFNQFPLALQDRYLCLYLRSLIYQHYFRADYINSTGSSGYLVISQAYVTSGKGFSPYGENKVYPEIQFQPQTQKNHSTAAAQLSSRSIFSENDTNGVFHLAFYQQLHESNQGHGFYDPDWLIIADEPNGLTAVQKDQLILHIERQKYLKPEEQKAAIGEEVTVWMPRNRLESGFYIAVGDTFFATETQLDVERVTVYLNIEADGAAVILQAITSVLNALAIPFQLKLPYDPSAYDCLAAGSLLLRKTDYPSVTLALQQVYASHSSYFRAEVPPFTQQLAPGWAIAEVPLQTFTPGEDFGLNRCHVIAEGLLTAWRNGQHPPDARLSAILDRFANLGFDWEHLYLNPSAADIYTPWDFAVS
jgi:hypothetical protein